MACPVISPSPRHLLHLGPHWGLTPSPAGLRSFHIWQNHLPVAGGADTTGKDVTVTLILRTPVQLWRNSVSSDISPILCLFAAPPSPGPWHILLPVLPVSTRLIFVCLFLRNQSDVFAAEMATSRGSAGLYLSHWAESRPPACGRASVHTLADDGLCLGGGELGSSDSPECPLARA